MRDKVLRLLVSTGTVAIYLLSGSGVIAQYYDDGHYAPVDDGMATIFGTLGIGVWCCLMSFGLIIFGFSIWMITDALKRDEKVLPKRVMWVILMFIFWPVSVYYYFARKRVLDAK